MSHLQAHGAARLAPRTLKRLAALASGASLLAIATGAWADAATDASSTSNLREVVVTAPRKEVAARAVQLSAPNLISVQSAETMAKYPDFNAAESLSRMPGISLSSDTGEGRFVNIRGIDGNLDGATFGGVPLLNTYPGGTYFSGGGRAVEFDTIPGGAIDGLIVTYTGLPDHEAEGLGGSVEVTPRSAANVTKPFLDGTLGWGYEPDHGHDGPINADLAAGVRFGFQNGHLVTEGVDATEARVGFFSNPTPFALVLTASSREDRRGFDDMEEDYNNPGSADRSYSDLQFRHYDYHRVRTGFGGEFDFTPNEDHTYFFRANVAGYTESVEKNRLTFDFGNDDGTDEPNQIQVGSGYRGYADMSVSGTDEQETHRNEVYAVGGRDRWGDVVLDYRASYSTASYDQNRSFGTTFTGPAAVETLYNNSGNNGDFPQIAVTDGTNINDPSLYNLKHGVVSAQQEHDLDQEKAFAANLLFPIHLINDSDRVKVGVEVRLRNKDQNVFVYGDGGDVDIGALNLADASTAADTNFYDHGYTNGPMINNLLVRKLAEAAQGTPVFDPSQYFAAQENIYSGYAQYTTTIGKFGILAGVRVESTDAKYDDYFFDAAGDAPVLESNPQRYTNVFPTVQLRYDFTSKLVLRATYSTGIGRPGFNQVAGAVSIDTSNGIITQGNPKLKPTTGNNFDLDLEYYLPGGGIAQVGVFDKEFSNYIVTNNDRVASDPRLPDFVGTVQLQTFSNVSSAYARGIEVAYHQQFLWLPDPWKGFGLDANATLVDSRFEEYNAATSGSGHAEFGLLPGTSKLTANFAAFYEAHGVEARISGEYVSAELFSLGGSKSQDTIQDNRLTLDWASSYAFNKNWKVYFNAKNLLNSPLRFYMGNPSFPIQREFYDVTYEAGIKVAF
jgi:TonB-dependent receptor